MRERIERGRERLGIKPPQFNLRQLDVVPGLHSMERAWKCQRAIFQMVVCGYIGITNQIFLISAILSAKSRAASTRARAEKGVDFLGSSSREICSVWLARKWQRLKAGKPTLTAARKSAEGVVDEPSRRTTKGFPKARTIPREGIEREGKSLAEERCECTRRVLWA